MDFLPLARSAASVSGASHTRRERAQLRYFQLPASETLLHYYSCFRLNVGQPQTRARGLGPQPNPEPFALLALPRLSASGRPQARCLLYLTPGWLCVYETLGGAAEKMRWEDLDQVHACVKRQTVVPSSIELVLKNGRQVIFGALLQREVTLNHMKELRQARAATPRTTHPARRPHTHTPQPHPATFAPRHHPP
eukprot:3029844-Prymnesium_polylepis.1